MKLLVLSTTAVGDFIDYESHGTSTVLGVVGSLDEAVELAENDLLNLATETASNEYDFEKENDKFERYKEQYLEGIDKSALKHIDMSSLVPYRTYEILEHWYSSDYWYDHHEYYIISIE